MKIRLAHVSNSSSSSFMLAMSGERGDVIISIKANLSEIGTIITSEEELNEYFVNEYGYDRIKTIEKVLASEGEWLLEKYEEAILALDNGRKIVVGIVANDDDNQISRLLADQGFPESDEYEIIEQVER